MCGIVTIVSKKQYGFIARDLNVFEQLLYADALRGEDSTGIIGVDKYGDMYIDKSGEDAHNFLISYVGSKAHKDMCSNGVALIGHNRKATMGKVSDDTAHPFVVNDNFAMVHNGTLTNHRQLKQTTVDSEALAYHLAAAIQKEGATLDDLGEALAGVWGAYACVWYDQLTHKVQFLRNDQRPLWIAESPDAWYLASEAGMLHWILARNSVQFKTLTTVETGKLYTLRPGSEKALTVEDIPEKKAAPVSSTNTGSGTGSELATRGATGAGDATSEPVSKNKFKRLSKKYVGTKIEFWVDDYVERYPFATAEGAKDYIVIGESDTLQGHKHIVRATVNLDILGLLSIEGIDNFFYSGTITAVEHDKRTSQLIVHVDRVYRIPSISTKQTMMEASNEKTATTLH